MNEPTTELKEWCVDWEVEVEVTLSKTVTYNATEIIEAETAEEAVEKVKADAAVCLDSDHVDIAHQVEPADFEIGDADMSTFKLNGRPTEWGS